MMPASELTTLQEVAASALDLTCTISRTTSAPSNIGTTSSTAVVATAVPCGLTRPSNAALMALAAIGKVGAVPDWVVSLPEGTDVRAGDTLTAIPGVSSDTLLVQEVQAPQSYSTLTQVYAREVR